MAVLDATVTRCDIQGSLTDSLEWSPSVYRLRMLSPTGNALRGASQSTALVVLTSV